MATLTTRVNGVSFSFDSRYHTPGAMTAALSMTIYSDHRTVYEIFQHTVARPGEIAGSETVGFVGSFEAAQDYASSLGAGYDFERITK